jgi:hypothetical protein
MNKFNLLITSMLISVSVNSVEPVSDIGKIQADNAVKLFFSTCVASEGKRADLMTAANSLKMQKMNGPATAHFIGTSAAIGWLQHKDSGSYILSSLDTGMCSIMSRLNDKDHLIAMLSDWLPKEEAGFKTKKINESDANGIASVSYLVTAKSGQSFKVVASASNKKNVKLQGLISYEKVSP